MTSRGLASALAVALSAALLSCAPTADRRMRGAWRGETVNGWIPVRLYGNPAQLGFQHGSLLAPEIADALAVVKLELTHDGKHDWAFYRRAVEMLFWPRVDVEYREELEGIVAGARARGVAIDIWDLVVMNANLELGYYTDWLDQSATSSAPDRCSAFVATGSWTRDGGIVIAHNNWSGYLEGARWNIIFDVRPERGQRILMDGFPGLIHSGDDFGLNSAGLAITETTISGFKGFDPGGIPEFVRARRAMQYATTIDEFARIMTDRNNGGYANTWLVADTKTNEIGQLELGLRHVTLERTRDGIFVGANFPINPKLIADETTWNPDDPGLSANARRLRWQELIAERKGRIDVAAAKRFMADHDDAVAQKLDAPSERTLCGHVDRSRRGMKPWQDEFAPAGTVQAKAADGDMVREMTLEAAIGHPCGIGFEAAAHLAQYPQFAWQKDLLRDLPSHPWTRFAAR
jgi:hypothetical protein